MLITVIRRCLLRLLTMLITVIRRCLLRLLTMLITVIDDAYYGYLDVILDKGIVIYVI